MIFSHAPIILPAVLKWPIKIYKPVLHLWFGLLQASLVLRLAGDLFQNPIWRKWGGLLNGITMLLFFATIAFIVQRQWQKRKPLRKA